MRFLALPFDDLERLGPLWFPFLKKISARSKEPIGDLSAQVGRREVEIGIVWDETERTTHALVGIRYRQRGADCIGEIIWLTGRGMREWRHLIGELEDYLRQRGCQEIRPICRPGWAPFLRERGYTITHYTMEKRL